MSTSEYMKAAKPGAHAEPFLNGKGWYLWLDGKLVDLTTNEMVARTFVDAINNHPNPFGVNPNGTLS